jgi:hypothetical protein
MGFEAERDLVPEALVLNCSNLFFAAIEKINRGGGGNGLLHEFYSFVSICP